MIYKVDLIRVTISEINQARFIGDIRFINTFIILFICLRLIESIIRNKIKMYKNNNEELII